VDRRPVGEVRRGDARMHSHPTNPMASADGWFHPGDLAVRNPACIAIGNRAKDDIVSDCDRAREIVG
jgi:hypothetical protein